MALFYQSGRVSRFAVGVPGFSTDRDLVLDVDGAIGVDTSEPRAAVDTPNISIRGDLFDSANLSGANSYFLSQDEVGVRWRAGNPSSLSVINIQDDGVQVGLGSFDTINFRGKSDDYVVDIIDGATNGGSSTLAEIVIDARFTKTFYGDNVALSTSYGSDGTMWSLPGYGTTEATGITSIGIGTIQPQADLQVGVGSTGVQIYGAEGKLEAITIEAENLKLKGNLSAESLVIDPGIATFRGNVEVVGLASYKSDMVVAGVATFNGVTVEDKLVTDFLVAGISTLGVGAGLSEFTSIQSSLDVAGTIGTFANDLYVGNDLFVNGETFLKQINAENITITGIASINDLRSFVGQSTYFTAGIATIDQVGFNTGIGTELYVERAVIGVSTLSFTTVGISTVGFTSIGNAFVGGAVTVTKVDVEDIEIQTAGVGTLTVGVGQTEGDATFFRTGIGSIVGFTTITGDMFVDGDLTVTQQFSVKDLGAENLEVTGIGTIATLNSEVGIVSTLFTAAQVNTGISTFEVVDTVDIVAAGGTIGDITLDGGLLEAEILRGDFLEIGVGTIGTSFSNIGIITYLSAGVGTIGTAFSDNLIVSGLSTINGVTFGSTEVVVSQTLTVLDQNGDGITLGDISDPKTGLTTVTGDLYVGNDLFVDGTQYLENIISENIYISGIGSVNELFVNTGVATEFNIDYLQVGLGTITNLISTASTITQLDALTLAVSTDPNRFPTTPGVLFADNTYFVNSVSNVAQIEDTISIGFTTDNTGVLDVNGFVDVSGISTFNDIVNVDSDIQVTGLTTTTFLYAGIGTIEKINLDSAEIDRINVGIATIGNLEVTGVTTFRGEVTIEDIIFINQEVTGVSTVSNQVITGIATINNALIDTETVGVSTVGLLSATDIQATFTDTELLNAGIATVGVLSVTESTSITGPTTITGITSIFGDLVIEGGAVISGVSTFDQLDSEQSQIGILTVSQLLDADGLVDAENVIITDSFLVTAGVSTLNFTNIAASLVINNDLQVGGVTTFIGPVNIQDTSFVNQEVTGISTVNNLFYNVGVGTKLSVGVATAGQFTVSGASTFVGVGTFQDDLYVSEDLYVERNVLVGTALTVPALVATGSTIGFATITDAHIGVATIQLADIVAENVGVSTIGFLTVTDSVSSGLATFTGFVDINTDLDVDGLSRLDRLVVTGVSTLNVVDISSADIDTAVVTDLTISTSRTGVSSVGIITVGYGDTTDGTFFRTGVGTIVGFTTYKGDVFIDGNQTITGVSSYAQLDAEGSRIGFLTVTRYLDADYIGSGPVGFATLNDISVNSGIFTSINATNVTVTDTTDTLDLEVQRNLIVRGMSTLGAVGPAGITTTIGDLYVGGDLYVSDDIFYDEISGRNLDISGVGTITQLFVNTGLATYFGFDTLNAQTGVITNFTSEIAEIDNIDVGFATVSDALNVTGISTFVGVSSFVGSSDFRQNVVIGGTLDVGSIFTGSDIFVSGSVAGAGASFINSLLGDVIVTGVTTTNFLNVSVAGTFTNLTGIGLSLISLAASDIQSDNIGNSGLITSTDLIVNRTTSLQDLTVNGAGQFLGEVDILNDLSVTGNAELLGITTSLDMRVSTNLLVGGATTTTSLDVNGGRFYATGLSTFANSLYVENGLNADTVTAPTGFISTISGSDLNYNTVSVNNNLTVSGTSEFSGISTFNTLDVTGTADVNTLDAQVALVNDLTFNVGTGTDLTATNANISNATVGIATVTSLDVTNAEIGIATVRVQLNHDNVTATDARKLTHSGGTETVIFSVNPGFRSFEFTVTVTEGTNYQSTKIHALHTGTDVIFNEYSTIYNNGEVATFDMGLNGTTNNVELRATPVSTNSTLFTTHLITHREN